MKDCTYCNEAKRLLDYSMKRVKGFSVWDFGILKTCLISFGVLVGARCTKFFRKYEIFVLLAFVASYIYLIYRMFARTED